MSALRTAIVYPSSDGKPMGETDLHVDETMALKTVLLEHFADEPDVYVASNNFFYYEEGDPKSVISPDLYVVRGIDKRQRRIYKLWEEGAAPCFILEVSSRKTWRKDFGSKKDLCARLGVAEYFLYDPEGATSDEPLQGFRLEGDGAYQRITPEADGTLLSETLGVRFKLGATESSGLRPLRYFNALTGAPLLRASEAYALLRTQAARADAQAARAEAEAAARRAAEDELARLRALLGQ